MKLKVNNKSLYISLVFALCELTIFILSGVLNLSYPAIYLEAVIIVYCSLEINPRFSSTLGVLSKLLYVLPSFFLLVPMVMGLQFETTTDEIYWFSQIMYMLSGLSIMCSLGSSLLGISQYVSPILGGVKNGEKTNKFVDMNGKDLLELKSYMISVVNKYVVIFVYIVLVILEWNKYGLFASYIDLLVGICALMFYISLSKDRKSLQKLIDAGILSDKLVD